MNEALVELIFMMGILKLPIVGLAALLWYAIRAEPEPFEGAPLAPEREPVSPPCLWRPVRRGAPRTPRGRPPDGRHVRRTKVSA